MPVPADGLIRARPMSADEFAVAPRVAVVDAAGVAAALAAGRVPVLRGTRRVYLEGGGIVLRDTAGAVLSGAARAHAADRSRVDARDEVTVDARDGALVVGTGPDVRVTATDRALVVAHAATVVATGAATVTVTFDGRCTASDAVLVRLTDGLVVAADDVRVIAEAAVRGVVDARNRVIVQHSAGVRVIAVGPDVHVISPGGPGPEDVGEPTRFTADEVADPATWARAWRLPLVDGHLALALDGYAEEYTDDEPAVATGPVPELPPRRELVGTRPLDVIPARDLGLRADEEAPDARASRLVGWVPLTAITACGPGPAAVARGMLSAGGARLERPWHTDLPRLTDRVGTHPVVHRIRGRSGWTVRRLAGPVDPSGWDDRVGWEVVPAAETPDRRAVLVDREHRELLVAGPAGSIGRADRRWWTELATRYAAPRAPTGPADGAARARQRPPPPVRSVAGAWSALGLVVGAGLLTVGVATVAPAATSGSGGDVAISLATGLVGALLAVLPWRVRPAAPPGSAAAPDDGRGPVVLVGGEHRVDRGTYVVTGPATVEASGTARIILPAGSPGRVVAAGYAEVDRLGGTVEANGHALVRDGSVPVRIPAAAPLGPLLERLLLIGRGATGHWRLRVGPGPAGLVDVLDVDGPLDRAVLESVADLPPGACWDDRAELLWLPSARLLVDTVTPAPAVEGSQRTWVTVLAAVPVLTAGGFAVDATAPPTTVVVFGGLFAATVVGAVLAGALPEQRRLRYRRRIVRMTDPT